MSNNIPNWPARTGIGGVALWIGVAVAALGAGGFVYTVLIGQ
ncbi:hypothetical protein [Mycetocola sp.]